VPEARRLNTKLRLWYMIVHRERQVENQVLDLKAKAAEELRKMRENCARWGVSEEIENIRKYVAQAGLTLADIGTSEEELQNCFRTGHINAAKAWLRIARERCEVEDVSPEVSHIRNLVAEAGLTLADVGTSDEELRRLLSAFKNKRSRWYRKLFSRRCLAFR